MNDQGPPLAVIVVNWNTPDLVLECVEALRKSEGAAWRLYLVDNASTDDSAERLRDLGDDVTLILSPVNGGWTGGNNLGVRRALADGCDRFFMLNSDALVLPDTLSKLLEQAERTPTAILGPVQLSPSGEHYNFAGSQVDPATGMPSYPRCFAVDAPEAAEIRDLEPTAYVQGSGLMIAKEHIDRLGLFDDRYYLNFDDTDYCAKAREAGYGVFMVKSARLLHHTSGSIGGFRSPISQYFLARNSLLYAREHCTAAQRRAHWIDFIRSGLSATWKTGRLNRVYTLLFGRDPVHRAFRRGYADYMLGRFGDCPPLIRRLQVEAKQRQ